MQEDWLDTFNDNGLNNFIDRVRNCKLLVIDDFGKGDIPPGFMGFFFDLIDQRIQWTSKGTVITTNLNDKEFTNYCGDALNDRFNLGQIIKFNDETRR